MLMDFGNRLKDLLAERKISVPQLAKMTGLNKNTLYSYIRRGTQKIDPVTMQKLSQALGVDVYFFLGTEQPNDLRNKKKEPALSGEFSRELTKEETEFISIFLRLTAENRRLLLANAKVYLQAQGDSSDSRD